MSIDEFFDLLFPGDYKVNVPSFSACDDRIQVEGFMRTVPQDFVEELKVVELNDQSPNELLKELKSSGRDMRPIIEHALSFYFSRTSVVIPLTGRTVPLTSSGVAEF